MCSNISNQDFCVCQHCNADPYITELGIDDITFVTIPRPFSNNDTLLRNQYAIGSWLASSPHAKVILFIDRKDFDLTDTVPRLIEEQFGKDRVSYLGNVKSDLNDIPYINSWFIEGLHKVRTKYVSFVNSDIILSSNWFPRVKSIFSALPDHRLVLINQRIDFDLDSLNSIRFDPKYILSDFDNMVNQSHHNVHSPLGIDIFTFRADRIPFNVEKIPPFVIGRYNWDNWLVGYLNMVCETVSLGINPPIYHMNHIRHKFDPEDNIVMINHHLRQANGGFFGSNSDTLWFVQNEKLVKRFNGESIDLIQ